MSNNKEMVCPICGSAMELYINEFGEYVYCTKCNFEHNKSKGSAVKLSSNYIKLLTLIDTY